MPEIRTMVDLVNRMRDAHPDHRLILVHARGNSDTFTWREFHAKVVRHAAWLQAAGLGRGDRVILCPTNEPDVLASFLAVFYLGAVPLSVSGAQLGQAPGSQLPFVADLVQRAGAKGVFTQGELIAGNDEAGAISPGQLIDYIPSSLDWETDAPEIPPARVDPSDLAFVQFSSGSTSRPKGVRISHRNVIENTRLVVESARRVPDEQPVTWLPLYHDMGLMATLFASLWHCPTSMTLMSPIRFLMKPLSWIEELSARRSPVSVCPNFALDLCTDRISDTALEAAQIDLSALNLLFVGAEPVRPTSIARFHQKFRAFGLRDDAIYPVYGLAEATLMVTAPHFREPIVTRTVDGLEVPSVGYPLGDFAIRITREDGGEAAPDEIGEIWLKGTSVSEGYLDEDANRELFAGGWLRTGDLGTRDLQGRLYITGRLKDLIIVNGKNYYAHDIVADLEQLPFVEKGKVAVLPLTWEGREQMVVLTVPVGKMTPVVRTKIAAFRQFMKHGGPRGWLKGVAPDQVEPYVEKLISSDRAELINEIKRYVLARFGVPVHDVVFVPKIPRTTSGKVRRDVCEQIYREQLQQRP